MSVTQNLLLTHISLVVFSICNNFSVLGTGVTVLGIPKQYKLLMLTVVRRKDSFCELISYAVQSIQSLAEHTKIMIGDD